MYVRKWGNVLHHVKGEWELSGDNMSWGKCPDPERHAEGCHETAGRKQPGES